MRTKTTVLTAAVLAAGALSSMAQNNVYSLNVVGYINLTIPTGYSLLANQLVASPDNKIGTVLGTNFETGMQVLKWNPATQGFGQPDSFYDAADTQTVGEWLDNNFNPSTTTISPGEAFFLLNPHGATNVTLVGQVTQGTNALPIGNGYSFLSVIPPVTVDLSTNGPLALPAGNNEGLQFFTFSNGSYSQPKSYYTPADTQTPTGEWLDNNFNPTTIIPAIGQGFVFLNGSGAPLTWTNTFSVQ